MNRELSEERFREALTGLASHDLFGKGGCHANDHSQPDRQTA